MAVTERSVVETMAKFTYILILLYLLKTSFAKDCADNKKTPEYFTWLKELLKDILSCSTRTPPPGNTTIDIVMNVESYSFQTDKEVFTAQTALNINWVDERLKWDPDKYHGIKEIEADPFLAWHPEIELINVADYFNSEMTTLFFCSIHNTGLITCRHKVLHETWCGVKLTNWPYDVQECSLEFGHEYMSKENYTYKLRASISEEYSAGWHVSELKQEDNAGGRPGVAVTFVLVREAAGLSAIFMYPALVLTVLNVLSLFLDVRRDLFNGTTGGAREDRGSASSWSVTN
ncbi:unnamed protein product [Spodoptera exigua]|nr:unnamed protein product [Spodoptera exigua]